MQRIIFLTNIVMVFLSGISHLSAQQINRDVVVVKPYEPMLSDVYKISPLPRIYDSASVKPTFHYSILPVRIDAPFEVKPIKPARMVGTPLEKLYNSYIRLGIGNFFTPVAEYNINSLRSKNRSIGAFYMHRSAGSKIALDNGDKVPAGYSVNQAEIYAKKFYDYANLSGRFKFKSDVVHYYGYNTSLFPDTIPDIKGKDIKQSYTRAGLEVRYNSTYSDSSHLNYDLNLAYNNFNDRHHHYENQLILSSELNKRFGEKLFGIDLGLTYNNTSKSIDSLATTLISASPYFSKKNADYEFQVGGKIFASMGNQKNFYIYPKASLQFNVVDRILVPYVGIDGKVILVTYEWLSGENPYVAPATSSEISDMLYVYAGLKGLLNSSSGFNIHISYSLVNNMPLFINDSTGKYDNWFSVVNDDVELLKYTGEIYYQPGEHVKFNLTGSIYQHTMSDEIKAWHKPDYEFIFQARYNLKKKLYANVNMNLIGTRYAKPYDTLRSYIKLDPVLDINLGLEYRYSKLFSVFADIYNLTSKKYYLWNQYPSRRLNFILGFTYKL